MKRRIDVIITDRPAVPLAGWKRAILATTAVLSIGVPVLAGSIRASSQNRSASERLEFDAVLIKPVPQSTVAGAGPRCHGIDSKFPSGDPGESVPLGRCASSATRLDNLMVLAYSVPSVQMIRVADGGPTWVKNNDNRFEFAATATDPSATTEQQLRQMLQAVLADRFKLKFHREMVETDGFAITVASTGPKMRKGRDDEEERVVRTGPGRDHIDMVATKVTMSRLALFLTTGAGKGPVVDKTGLDGAFDFTLNSDENAGPSLFTAMQEQLGLKLERQKVPVEWFVIDSAEKPVPQR